jgi:hypothetical protein
VQSGHKLAYISMDSGISQGTKTKDSKTTLGNWELMYFLPKPFPDWSVTHECTNWEKLDAWAHERVMAMTNTPVHPELRGGYVDPATMSKDAKFFLEQVHEYKAKKKQAEEKAMHSGSHS